MSSKLKQIFGKEQNKKRTDVLWALKSASELKNQSYGVLHVFLDGVDTRACDAASGVTTSATTGNSAASVLRGKQPLRDFGGDVSINDGVNTQASNVSIDNGVDTQACDADSGITTSGTTGNSAAAVPRRK